MKIGNLDISNPKIGTVEINKVYSGIDLVWERSSATGFKFQVNVTTSFTFNPTTSGTVDYLIIHGDGNSTQVNSAGSVVLNYASSGVYDIEVKVVSGITDFNLSGNNQIIDILNFTSDVYSWRKTFEACSNLVAISATDYPISNNGYQNTFDSCNITAVLDGWVLTGSCAYMFKFNSSIEMTNFTTVGVTTFIESWRGTDTGNSDLSTFDLTSVISMFRMFNGSSGDKNILSSPTLCANMRNCFRLTSISNSSYRAMLNSWTGWNGLTATKSLQSNVSAHFGGAKYEIGGESQDIRNYLINTLGWTITDGGGV